MPEGRSFLNYCKKTAYVTLPDPLATCKEWLGTLPLCAREAVVRWEDWSFPPRRHAVSIIVPASGSFLRNSPDFAEEHRKLFHNNRRHPHSHRHKSGFCA